MLVLLFFTQAALAMSGCLTPVDGLAKIIATAATSDCDGGRSMNLNLCQAHCTADDQSLGTSELPPLSSLLTVVLVVPTIKYAAQPTFASNVPRVEHTGDPPKPIRFCSFQI